MAGHGHTPAQPFNHPKAPAINSNVDDISARIARAQQNAANHRAMLAAQLANRNNPVVDFRGLAGPQNDAAQRAVAPHVAFNNAYQSAIDAKKRAYANDIANIQAQLDALAAKQRALQNQLDFANYMHKNLGK